MSLTVAELVKIFEKHENVFGSMLGEYEQTAHLLLSAIDELQVEQIVEEIYEQIYKFRERSRLSVDAYEDYLELVMHPSTELRMWRSPRFALNSNFTDRLRNGPATFFGVPLVRELTELHDGEWYMREKVGRWQQGVEVYTYNKLTSTRRMVLV